MNIFSYISSLCSRFIFHLSYISSVQLFSHFGLCDPMVVPGFPVHNQLLEFAQTHIYIYVCVCVCLSYILICNFIQSKQHSCSLPVSCQVIKIRGLSVQDTNNFKSKLGKIILIHQHTKKVNYDLCSYFRCERRNAFILISQLLV